jgi:hypothetical protein
MIFQYFFRHQGVAPYESRDAPGEKTDAPLHSTKFQDRLSDVEFGKNPASLSSQFAASANRRFQFHKRTQFLICAHNETLSVVAVRVCNPDRSPLGINR